MISEKKIASAVGAKTARACDYCVRKRARWYCAADDAFLCQVCDGSVHSANPLARRHERVRLKTASLKPPTDELCLPSWHRGLTKKPRTPRHRKQANNRAPLVVPELDTSTSQDEEEQLLYRVPVFDPFVAELSPSTVTSNELALAFYDGSENVRGESKSMQSVLLGDDVQDGESNSSHRFLPSDFDLAEFAADVETLLGKGLDGESYGIEELGLLDCQERGSVSSGGGALIKAEKDDLKAEEMVLRPWHREVEMEVIREPFELKFNYDSHRTYEEGDMKVVTEPMVKEKEGARETTNKEKREWNISLRLDYNAISMAWADQGSPWMNGKRPDINPDDCWPQTSMGDCGAEVQPYGIIGGQAPSGDGGREARVSRYREKRRTRLFSKKIRYEVRKLNAEKRPRMKGRFVKRSSINPTPFPLLSK